MKLDVNIKIVNCISSITDDYILIFV